MKECEVDMQWNHVRHVPKCEDFCWLKPHKDEAAGSEEYGDKKVNNAPWSVKFETTESTKYKVVSQGKIYEGNTSDKKW
jgi:hypothetical protein